MLKKYIRYNIKKWIFIIVSIALCFAALYLENIEYNQLVYPLVLVLFIWLVYVGMDFYKYNKLHKNIECVKNNIDVTLERMQEPENYWENEYQELIKYFFDVKEKELEKYKQSRKNLEEFLTIWTHQIKTPLTALELANSELANKELANKELANKEIANKENLNIGQELSAKESAERLFEIEQYCDNMLTYLRIGDDGSDYLFKEQNVLMMVREAVKYFARTFIYKGLSVKINIDEKVRVVTDEKWLVFVLKQVLSNALKYTKKGSITIEMQKDNIIRITDTGIGIRAEDLPRIMERGYTGYNGRVDKKATGMGLFLVNSIMKMLNGSVKIESELGRGTVVSIILPELGETHYASLTNL